jgi:hypothetical protein
MHRNKRNIDRSYWGYHLPGLVVTDIDLTQEPAGYSNMVINWDNPRTIYYIPVDEVLANTLCEQNP